MLQLSKIAAAALLFSGAQATGPAIFARTPGSSGTPAPTTLTPTSTTTASTETSTSTQSSIESFSTPSGTKEISVTTPGSTSTDVTVVLSSTTGDSVSTTPKGSLTGTEVSADTSTPSGTKVSFTTDKTGSVTATTTPLAGNTRTGSSAATTDVSTHDTKRTTATGKTATDVTRTSGSHVTGTATPPPVVAVAVAAQSSFSNVAAAASSIAANPSPSVQDVQQFQDSAKSEQAKVESVQSQLKDMQKGNMGHHDSEIVAAALVGLASLLTWFGTQMTAVGTAVATPALAASVFADLAPAFGAALAAGGLLDEALNGLEDLDGENDDNNNHSHTKDNHSETKDSPTASETKPATTEKATTTAPPTSASTTETATTTASSGVCSALRPADDTLPIPDDADDSDDYSKRSLGQTSPLEARGIIKKRVTATRFGNCNPNPYPKFPKNINAKGMVSAELAPKAGDNQLYINTVVRWVDIDIDCKTSKPGWTLRTTEEAQAIGLANFNIDHVWELKFFNNFFDEILPGTDPDTGAVKAGFITCDEFEDIFPPSCLLDQLAKSAPGAKHPEFMAIRKSLNTMKGSMFLPGRLADGGKFEEAVGKSTETKITSLQEIGIVLDLLGSDKITALFDTTHLRMYNGFVAVDDRVATEKIKLPDTNYKFAKGYDELVTRRLGQATDEAWAFVQKWMASVESDIATLEKDDAADEEKKKRIEVLKKSYQAWKDTDYSTQGHYTLKFKTGLSAGGASTDVTERDLFPRGSCPRRGTTNTATGVQSTVTTPGLTKTAGTSATGTPIGTATGTTTGAGTTATPTKESTALPTTTSTAVGQSTATPSTFQTLSRSKTTDQNTPQGTSSTTANQTPGSTLSTATTQSHKTSSETPSTTLHVSTETTLSTNTRKVLHAVTKTANGEVCVLVDGSNDPACHPLSIPTANPAGTNVHVQSGCILINESPRCASDAGNIASVYESSYNVASDPNQPWSTALILSGFDNNDDNHLHAKATCQLQARWPANYGDVTFGSDGCLYDSGNNKIYDQCCSTPDVNNNGPATNPYVAPQPADASQFSGNNKGSSICHSLRSDTCLSAASRFMDDVVYHQYTSAVWPDASGADIANDIFPIAGPIIEDFFGINYGCTVIFKCDNDDAFSKGMTGKQIKDAIVNLRSTSNVKKCGTTYLDNSCHVTMNGCNNCKDYGRAQTIWSPYAVANGSYADAGDGFPPTS